MSRPIPGSKKSQISSSSSGSESSDEELRDDAGMKASKWVDEDEIDGVDTEEESSDEEAHENNLESFENDLASLPLGIRLNAQRALKKDTESDSESNSESDSEPEAGPSTIQSIKSSERVRKPLKVKRSNKHAPMEVTSKKPVPRRRTVVEVKKIVSMSKNPYPGDYRTTSVPQPSRDPRFTSGLGDVSQDHFQHDYSFLTDMHREELKTLKDSLKRAKKQLFSSPRETRAERDLEVQRLEMAVKRAESTVNKETRTKLETEAMKKITAEEREKQKSGKGKWFMKQGEKKSALLRARYEAIAESGGSRAVKKIIEKKQRKIAQKEKKSRPFPAARDGRGGTGSEGQGLKRKRSDDPVRNRKVRRPRTD
ncbi:hypothetical protein SISSUDRAFT_1062856 [Sistotremastrum suecicum HHB10207 ss-3]|uniref:rRNA biogenesis protein RRP36 n=1 Tax=Sistotremastrum suecicum HHB10207 ss-3 TaxID=1314776 RepID=A0A166CFH3_9AGAM|nr:hypothetical protein SISSUDRAFT_1062856 [Sistotremastrum suecicum HHB10207 ss-3]